MIIECTNCNKKFEVEPELIPEKGRSIQCGSCNHKWFYKKDTQETILEINHEAPLDEIEQEIKVTKDVINKKADEKKITEEIVKERTEIKQNNEEKPLKKSNILNKIISYLVVAIISFVALIIVLDTFKTPLNNIFPNLELLLFNLYETFEDIGLFVKDLIK
jgi:predicted Zn finger-like uncharacterized protein